MDATSFKKVLKFFICLEMPVNITQYRGSAGIFNNRNFVFRPKFTNFIEHTCWGTNHMYFKLYLVIFSMNLALFLVFAIAVLSPRCSFYITSRNWLLPLLYYPIICGLRVIYFCYVVMLNSIQDLIRILQKNFQFVNGTLIA